MTDFRAALGNRLIFVDGAFGTMLQRMGLPGGEAPVLWNETHPKQVKDVYAQYLAAGCEVVTANTFGADEEGLFKKGLILAREAITESGRDAWLAADLGPSGRLMKPYGDLDFEDAVALAAKKARWAKALGADLVLIETMTDLREIKALTLGVKEGCDLPVIVSMAFEQSGRLLSGATIEGAAAMLTGLRADGIGLNCGHEPEKLLPVLKRLLAVTNLPVLFSPNASLPHVEGGETRYAVTPESYALSMKKARGMGATLLGGCCGTTPAHIQETVSALRGEGLAKRTYFTGCLISGTGDAVCIGGAPVAIGERINPTGKPLLKAALREGDMAYLQREAVRQLEAGATVLDVNAGLPDIDEKALLKTAVESVQQATDAPLQIDTADERALENALRAYVGKPLINSVSGKQAVMDAVFPLARKYGGAIVALTLDEDGIPQTSEGRIAIARRIIKEAEKYGIPKSELLFDALTLSVSADPQAARVTLDTVSALHSELGVKTVLGVSNVSFGLPSRPLLTAAFLTMAIEKGLSAAILNPLDETVMGAFDAASAVCGLDAGFEGYIARHAAQKAEKAAAGEAPDVKTAILRGLPADAKKAAETLLDAGAQPLCVVNEHILPALTEVGALFEKGERFLPQLLASAGAAQAAFEAVKARFPQKESESRGRVVLATVEGDVHDIGKNIVKVLLENYGFTVHDLGRDVKPQQVLDAARASDTRLVGLSALMTTTVPAMERTIALLKKELPGVLVMVGGAVLTEDYARAIGADFYGRDAMASVKYALTVYGEGKQAVAIAAPV